MKAGYLLYSAGIVSILSVIVPAGQRTEQTVYAVAGAWFIICNSLLCALSFEPASL